MSLSPLTPVTDYQSMLNRIFWFTSAAALAAVWMLRAKLPVLDVQLRQIDFTVGFGDDKLVPIPGGYLLPALAMGLGSRVFRIHSLLARWLGVRERFDIDVIIGELARRTQFDLQDVSDEQLAQQRHKLMRRAFYRFVGGGEPQIDRHLILRALDLWSWFWIGMEATFVFVLVSFVFLSTGLYWEGAIVLASTLGLAAVALPVIRSECRRYAIAQVRAIVSEDDRAALVRAAFEDVLDHAIAPRRAA
ncbi:MAG: hypothetical protein AAGD11_11235 [Planctomycetota bacterium]